MPSFVDSNGNPIKIDRELARGGEGSVFEIAGNKDNLAKVYFNEVSANKAKKLFLMPGMISKDLLEISSWPLDVLFDRKGGKLKGFIMPLVKGREIHDLYIPASRKQFFINADWSFLIHVARNLAAAVDTIHTHGHVIGDLNQKGILVQKNGLLRLIDCDSFQIRYNDTTFLCDVGVRDFTPPELQDKSFQGVVRTCNHDNFALAVLCFQLLFLGRHPFVGRYHVHGDVSLERAIKELYYVYGSLAPSKKLEPPPHTLPIAVSSNLIVTLFEKAFSKDGAFNNGRPQAIEWVRAFDKLNSELYGCNKNSLHKYHKSLVKCPWCELELVLAPFFVDVRQAGIDLGIGSLDVNQLWQKIISIPLPGAVEIPKFNFNNAIGKPLPTTVTLAKYKKYGVRALSIGLSGIILLSLTVFSSIWFILLGVIYIINKVAFSYEASDGGETTRRKNALLEAQRSWNILNDRWYKEATNLPFQEKMAQLKAKKTEYENLPKAYNGEKQKLQAKQEELQKQHFLEKFPVQRANIDGIGPSLKNVLASYGVQTANDITKNLQYNVPNFGPRRTADLLAWRKKIESTFKFNPTKGIDPADIAVLKNKFAIQKKQLEEYFAKGIGELQEIRNRTLRKRTELTSHLEIAAHDLAQAQADVKLL